jgi:membrane protein
MDVKTFKLRHLPSLFRATFFSWVKLDPWRLSTVVAFYAILTLPGLLVVILNALGAYFGDFRQAGLVDRITEIAGEEAANAVQLIIEASGEETRGGISTLFGFGTLIFGAMGAFYHIQYSLNLIWEVKPGPEAGIKKFILDRLLGFSFLIIIGLLMYASFFITAALAVFSDYIDQSIPLFSSHSTIMLNEFLTFAALTVLFALMFRFLPDAKISWKNVWIGAIITSLLFVLGRLLMGLYFGRVNPATTFGAAGSVVLILLWVAYSAMIFFFGSQFTCEYAKKYGKGIVPKPHAVRVRRREEIV